MPDDDEEPAVTVTVTLKEIYKEVLATKALVTPLPSAVADHEMRLRTVEQDKLSTVDFRAETSDHEARIRVVEEFKGRLTGAHGLLYGVLVAAGSSVIAFLLQRLAHG